MVHYKPYFERRYPWIERCVALLALLNLALVFFDLTYLYGRNFYFSVFPALTRYYDPIKGIQPHPETQYYLQQVETLETQLATGGWDAPQVERSLAPLSPLSQRILAENPFAGANQNSSLETIKQQMRQRTGETFALDAFETFWSADYLQQRGWQSELAFWQAEIRPLMQTNYYRGVNQWGLPTNRFWLLDLPFVIIFALDIAARLWGHHRRHPNLSWLDIALRRWYDFLLLIPFWRWLRVLPVAVRLNHSEVVTLEPVRAELQRDLIASFATETAQMIGIQIIDQMQASIERGEFIRTLFHPELSQRDRPELTTIATRLVGDSLRQAVPQVQADLEDLVQYSITSSLNQFPGYRQLRRLPGLQRLSSYLTPKLAQALFRIFYHNLGDALQDPVGAQITTRLRRNFRDALERELLKRQNIQEVQSSLIEFLEDIKFNYVKNLTEMEGRQLIERAEELHKQVRG
ncbi:hypothetical protein H6G20_01040 [Desertifilum sp. FACHB-1129]|uniref:Uncharacterized protein n=2 Tax=Desertifilum tharense IPPAS B-1220 TaxID=1781255 RepID=A0A1E5QND9_9CYAN|nr:MULTISPECIES: hypothetical protein [Desertifilum]MDA0210320.1 hypothetical protein [Cyanobacteria bacterium FC1]MBD2310267.1 hypothetical protein [Desertifilum sp. FACHB-1129]MBD2322643.1 hypothetical protein [Desertifilum sp. FACHB-866]MBD2333521.1 hypothetical protein [Desertifilum sp. FACHB-868]OEJ76186.1 hypothetical protein BH720_06455 [Desertifilum tharense IPPAS B-1220]